MIRGITKKRKTYPSHPLKGRRQVRSAEGGDRVKGTLERFAINSFIYINRNVVFACEIRYTLLLFFEIKFGERNGKKTIYEEKESRKLVRDVVK